MRRFAAGAVLLVAAIAAPGCTSGNPGDISRTAAKTLQQDVQHVREVAAGGSYAELRAAVAALKAQVEQFQQDGQVSASRAVAIEDAADALLQAASPSPSPTPSPTTTSPTPTPTTTSPTPTPSPTTTTPPPVIPTTTSPTAGNNGNGNGGQPISIGGSATP
jgi:hypothetical protein